MVFRFYGKPKINLYSPDYLRIWQSGSNHFRVVAGIPKRKSWLHEKVVCRSLVQIPQNGNTGRKALNGVTSR